MITTRTRLLAAACALGLSVAGLSACSDAQDKAKDSAGAVQSELDKAGDAAVNGSKKADTKADKAMEDAKAATSEAADAVKDAADKSADAAKKSAAAAKEAAKEGADSAKDAAHSGAETMQKKASELQDAASDVKKAAEETTKDVMNGDMVDVTDANGATVQIPAAIATKAKALGASTLGALVSVKNSGGKWVASYANGWHIAYSEATGAQPVKGKIGQVWFDGGNISNPVGLPTAPEQTKPNNDGWTQQFTHGEIWAGMDGSSGTVQK